MKQKICSHQAQIIIFFKAAKILCFSFLPQEITNTCLKDYYTNWFNTLQKTLLPLIHKSLSSSSSQTLLYSHVDLLFNHFLSYYDAFDNAATQENLPEPLFPSWHNGLEIPFLFLCDLHPYVLTNLKKTMMMNFFDNRLWQVFMAWRNVSKNLMSQIEQIEFGLRLIQG
ncbi:protein INAPERTURATE POLLEN1 [Citrus sinensis]|uniref:Protein INAPERTURATE POLLEN1 n=1 Tax=Citrus sinensis TaxID=2711 RepID=A0ACB8N572_CITSI|nr:protein INAPERTURATE POLLEN1 [Citrus sinensis]